MGGTGMTLARTLLATVALAALAAPASAVTYAFTLSKGLAGRWELPASPVPDADYGDAFRINSVSGTLNGTSFTSFMEFFGSNSGGGVCAGFTCRLFDLYGPQLYTGTSAAPTFKLGTFAMLDATGRPRATLRINALPEPGSWAMMIAGFGLVGAGLRRRRATATA